MADKVQNIMELDDATQKKIMEQYELIRQAGLTNMFDMTNVKYIAERIGHTELYNFMQGGMKSYGSILRNFGNLMKKFDIKQD